MVILMTGYYSAGKSLPAQRRWLEVAGRIEGASFPLTADRQCSSHPYWTERGGRTPAACSSCAVPDGEKEADGERCRRGQRCTTCPRYRLTHLVFGRSCGTSTTSVGGG